MDCFLYERDLRHERVNRLTTMLPLLRGSNYQTPNLEIAKTMNPEEVHHLHLGVQERYAINQCLYALKTLDLLYIQLKVS